MGNNVQPAAQYISATYDNLGKYIDQLKNETDDPMLYSRLKYNFILASGAMSAFAGIANGDTSFIRSFSKPGGNIDFENLFRALGTRSSFQSGSNAALSEDYQGFLKNALENSKVKTADTNGNLSFKAGKESVPKTYQELFDLALNPYNEFTNIDTRRSMISKLINDVSKTKDQRGMPFFDATTARFFNQQMNNLSQWYGGDQGWFGQDYIFDRQRGIASNPVPEHIAQFGMSLKNIGLVGYYDKANKANRDLGIKAKYGDLPQEQWFADRIAAGLATENEIANGANQQNPNVAAQRFQTGGMVYASAGQFINFEPRGTDTVPAMLTPGEFVVNAQATRQNLPLLQSINKSSGGVIYRAAGGGSDSFSMTNMVPSQSSADIRNEEARRRAEDSIARNTLATAMAIPRIATTTTDTAEEKLPGLLNTTRSFHANDNKNFGNINRQTTHIGKIADTIPSFDKTSNDKLDELLRRTEALPVVLPALYQNSTAIMALILGEQQARQPAGLFGGLNAEQNKAIGAGLNAARKEGANLLQNMGFMSGGGVVYASNGMMIPYAPKGTDTVPAMLTPGEFVVNAQSTRENLPLLQSINSGVEHMATGGLVPLLRVKNRDRFMNLAQAADLEHKWYLTDKAQKEPYDKTGNLISNLMDMDLRTLASVEDPNPKDARGKAEARFPWFKPKEKKDKIKQASAFLRPYSAKSRSKTKEDLILDELAYQMNYRPELFDPAGYTVPKPLGTAPDQGDKADAIIKKITNDGKIVQPDLVNMRAEGNFHEAMRRSDALEQIHKNTADALKVIGKDNKKQGDYSTFARLAKGKTAFDIFTEQNLLSKKESEYIRDVWLTIALKRPDFKVDKFQKPTTTPYSETSVIPQKFKTGGVVYAHEGYDPSKPKRPTLLDLPPGFQRPYSPSTDPTLVKPEVKPGLAGASIGAPEKVSPTVQQAIDEKLWEETLQDIPTLHGTRKETEAERQDRVIQYRLDKNKPESYIIAGQGLQILENIGEGLAGVPTGHQPRLTQRVKGPRTPLTGQRPSLPVDMIDPGYGKKSPRTGNPSAADVAYREWEREQKTGSGSLPKTTPPTQLPLAEPPKPDMPLGFEELGTRGAANSRAGGPRGTGIAPETDQAANVRFIDPTKMSVQNQKQTLEQYQAALKEARDAQLKRIEIRELALVQENLEKLRKQQEDGTFKPEIGPGGIPRTIDEMAQRSAMFTVQGQKQLVEAQYQGLINSSPYDVASDRTIDAKAAKSGSFNFGRKAMPKLSFSKFIETTDFDINSMQRLLSYPQSVFDQFAERIYRLTGPSGELPATFNRSNLLFGKDGIEITGVGTKAPSVQEKTLGRAAIEKILARVFLSNFNNKADNFGSHDSNVEGNRAAEYADRDDLFGGPVEKVGGIYGFKVPNTGTVYRKSTDDAAAEFLANHTDFRITAADKDDSLRKSKGGVLIEAAHKVIVDARDSVAAKLQSALATQKNKTMDTDVRGIPSSNKIRIFSPFMPNVQEELNAANSELLGNRYYDGEIIAFYEDAKDGTTNQGWGRLSAELVDAATKTYKIDTALAKKGYGSDLYYAVMEHITQMGGSLTPDSLQSDEAIAVWEKLGRNPLVKIDGNRYTKDPEIIKSRAELGLGSEYIQRPMTGYGPEGAGPLVTPVTIQQPGTTTPSQTPRQKVFSQDVDFKSLGGIIYASMGGPVPMDFQANDELMSEQDMMFDEYVPNNNKNNNISGSNQPKGKYGYVDVNKSKNSILENFRSKLSRFTTNKAAFNQVVDALSGIKIQAGDSQGYEGFTQRATSNQTYDKKFVNPGLTIHETFHGFTNKAGKTYKSSSEYPDSVVKFIKKATKDKVYKQYSGYTLSDLMESPDEAGATIAQFVGYPEFSEWGGDAALRDTFKAFGFSSGGVVYAQDGFDPSRPLNPMMSRHGKGPTSTLPQQPITNFDNEKLAEEGKAFIYGAAKSVLPGLAGLGAGVLGLPTTGPGGFAIGLGAGAAVYQAQENYLNTLAPETNRQMKDTTEEHWQSSLLGSMVVGFGIDKIGRKLLSPFMKNAARIPAMLPNNNASVRPDLKSASQEAMEEFSLRSRPGIQAPSLLNESKPEGLLGSILDDFQQKQLTASAPASSMKKPLVAMPQPNISSTVDDLKGLQYSRETIPNLVGNGERPLFSRNLPQDINPQQIEAFLAKDRAELETVAKLMDPTGRTSSEQAAKKLAERMVELIVKARTPSSLQQSGDMAMEMLRSQKTIPKRRLFGLLEGKLTPEQQLQNQQISDAQDLLYLKTLNPGSSLEKLDSLRTKGNMAVRPKSSGLDALRSRLPKDLLGSLEDNNLAGENIGVHLGFQEVRGRGDTVFSHGNTPVLRLNSTVIDLARRGIYQKPVQTPDIQQQIYPTSPLDFYQRFIAPQNKSSGGVIYASTGTLVNYQPRGTDTVPAMLTPGEFVVNRSATEQHLPLLQAINSGNYSNGGKIEYLATGTRPSRSGIPLFGGLSLSINLGKLDNTIKTLISVLINQMNSGHPRTGASVNLGMGQQNNQSEHLGRIQDFFGGRDLNRRWREYEKNRGKDKYGKPMPIPSPSIYGSTGGMHGSIGTNGVALSPNSGISAQAGFGYQDTGSKHLARIQDFFAGRDLNRRWREYEKNKGKTKDGKKMPVPSPSDYSTQTQVSTLTSSAGMKPQGAVSVSAPVSNMGAGINMGMNQNSGSEHLNNIQNYFAGRDLNRRWREYERKGGKTKNGSVKVDMPRPSINDYPATGQSMGVGIGVNMNNGSYTGGNNHIQDYFAGRDLNRRWREYEKNKGKTKDGKDMPIPSPSDYSNPSAGAQYGQSVPPYGRSTPAPGVPSAPGAPSAPGFGIPQTGSGGFDQIFGNIAQSTNMFINAINMATQALGNSQTQLAGGSPTAQNSVSNNGNPGNANFDALGRFTLTFQSFIDQLKNLNPVINMTGHHTVTVQLGSGAAAFAGMEEKVKEFVVSQINESMGQLSRGTEGAIPTYQV
jgi:hypothetical protein